MISDDGTCSGGTPEAKFRSREFSEPAAQPTLKVCFKDGNVPLIYGYALNTLGAPCPNLNVSLDYECDDENQFELTTTTNGDGYYEFLKDDFQCEEWYNICQCTVILGPVLDSKITHYVPRQLDFGPSCPYVSVWDGEKYIRDNNILPQSEGNGGFDEDDCYLLRVNPVETSNRYHLRIEEFENECTSADQFSLIAVDHDPDVNLAVDGSGEIFIWKDPRPVLSVLTKSGDDVTRQLTMIDGDCAQMNAGETLIIGFGELTPASDARLIVRICSKSDRSKLDNNDEYSEWADTRDRKAAFKLHPADGDILEINPRIQPRENGVLAVADVTDMIPSQKGDFNLELALPADHLIDFIGLDISEQQPLIVSELDLLSAKHSLSGDVTSALAAVDCNYAKLSPNEHIDLCFGRTATQHNSQRDFILKSTGHYETIGSESIPSSGILANYPNPFNPSTEVVFNLVRPSHVRLDVFNIMGQRVATIMDEFKHSGVHRAYWNGMSESGHKAGTGVYFCKMSYNEGSACIKMVLMK